MTTPSPLTASTKHSKKKKSKSKDSDGYGVGDCDCDGGMLELRLLYSGSDTVDIDFYDKSGDGLICQSLDVEQGSEATCNVAGTSYSKFETNTYVNVINQATNLACTTVIHTSCSRDIVGTYGDEDCGVVVSGWYDADGNCDDGYDECSCDGSYVYDDNDPYEDDVVQTGDVCFCSNIDETANLDLSSLTTPAPVASKKKKKKSTTSLGYGYCDDCDGGIQILRFVYTSTTTADTVTLYYDDYDGDVICTTTDVTFGQEIECNINDSGLGKTKFNTNSYLSIEKSNGETCQGSWHTSCSQDLVGYTPTGCTDAVCTGWQDNNSDGDCDDGFEPCECVDPCAQYSVGCETYSGCAYDSTTDSCYSISAAPITINVYQILAFVSAFFIFYN